MFIIRGDTPPLPPWPDLIMTSDLSTAMEISGGQGAILEMRATLALTFLVQRCLSARAARPSNTTIAEKSNSEAKYQTSKKRALIIQLQPVQIIFKLNCIRNELIQNCILSVKNEAQCVVSFASRSVGRSALQIANAIEAKRGRHVYTTRK